MKKNILKITSSILGIGVVTTAITLPITSCSKEDKKISIEEQLTNLWINVNDYIIKNKITVSSNNSIETNWARHSDKIIKIISNFKLNDKLLIEYSDLNQITIQRDLASISFKLNINKLGISTIKLHEGYIVLDKNGTLHFNNLAISSPDDFFEFDPENKEVILGLSELGKTESDILVPYGTKEIIKENGFSGNANIKNIILPDTLITLPRNFANFAKNLEYIKLSRTLKELPNMSLSDTNLKKVDWYEGLETIGEWVFFQSKLADNLVVPKSVKVIKNGAFRDMSQLNSISIWTSNIKQDVFTNSNSLKRINLVVDKIIPDTLDMDAFKGIFKNTKLYVKNEEVKSDIINICIKNSINPDLNIKESQIIVSENLENQIKI